MQIGKGILSLFQLRTILVQLQGLLSKTVMQNNSPLED